MGAPSTLLINDLRSTVITEQGCIERIVGLCGYTSDGQGNCPNAIRNFMISPSYGSKECAARAGPDVLTCTLLFITENRKSIPGM